MMDIEELTKKVREATANAHLEDRAKTIEDLRSAKIIDDEGYYHPDYFSKETVENDRKRGKPMVP